VSSLAKRRCSRCAAPLSRFLGNWYCPQCTVYEPTYSDMRITEVPAESDDAAQAEEVIAVEWTDDDGGRVSRSFAHADAAREVYAALHRAGRNPRVVRPKKGGA